MLKVDVVWLIFLSIIVVGCGELPEEAMPVTQPTIVQVYPCDPSKDEP